MGIRKKVIKFILKLAISLLFAAWLVFNIDWNQTLLYIGKISPWQVVLYGMVLLAGMGISALKWQILTQIKGFRMSFGRCFELYLAGTFINNFMPSFIGGDTYKAYQIGKSDKKYIAAAATVVADRITGLLGAMFLSVFFAALNWRTVADHKILASIVGIIFLLLMAILFLKMIGRLSFWKKYIPEKIFKIVKDLAEYENDKKMIPKVFLLSIFYNLFGLGIVNYVLFWSLGIQIGILDYLTVIFLISIVSALPVSINNIGIKEWAYVTFFGFFGVASSAVVAVALISRIIQMVVSFGALPYYLKNK